MSEQNELCAALNRQTLAIEGQAQALNALAAAIQAQAVAIGEMIDGEGEEPEALTPKSYLSGKPR